MSNKVKEEIAKYEIKTSSREILNSFYEKRDAKRNMNKSRFHIIKLVSSVLVAASLLFAFIKIVIPDDTKSKNPSISNSIPIGAALIDDDKENHVAFQLLSGVSLLGFIDEESPVDLLVRRKQNITYDQFSEVVDVFDKANKLINNCSHSDINKKVYEGNFTINNNNYCYMMDIYNSGENVIIYYDSKIQKDGKHEIETEFHGEIHYKNKVYNIIGEKETENNDEEFEITIFINESSYIEIEQEIENNEYEYKYLIYENNKKIYEIDYSINSKHTLLEIKDNFIKYRFNITDCNTHILIEYSFLDVAGKITLQYGGDSRIYFEEFLSKEIVKK